jgi:hypothetical protein
MPRALNVEDPAAGVDEEEAQFLVPDSLIEAPDVADQVEELDREFRPGEARAGHDESECCASLRGVRFGIGPLQHRDDVVAQAGCVIERLEGERMRLKAGEAVVIGHGSEGEHEVVIGHCLKPTGGGGADRDDSPAGIDRVDLGAPYLGVGQHGAQRDADMLCFEFAARYLREHRREEQMVAPAHQHNADVPTATQQLL